MKESEIDDQINQHEDLINLFKIMPAISTPEHLTDRIMQRLPDIDQSFRSKALSFLSRHFGPDIQTRYSQSLSVSNSKDLSFCFFLTGLFYFILGIIVMFGFRAVDANLTALEWIKPHTYLIVITAIWLFILSLILLKESSAIIKIVQYGNLAYIFLTILNGIFIAFQFQTPSFYIFALGFAFSGVFMGLILELAIERLIYRIRDEN